MTRSFSRFGELTAEQVKNDLAYVISGLVAVAEPLYMLRQGRAEGFDLEVGQETSAERLFYALWDSLDVTLSEACAVDPSFRVLIPEGALAGSHPCVEVVTGPGGGFNAWRSRAQLVPVSKAPGFGIGPAVAILIGLGIVSLGGAGYAYFASRDAVARTEAQKELARAALELRASGMSAEGIAQAFQSMGSVTVTPPNTDKDPIEKLTSSIGSLVVVGLLGYAAVTWGPKLIDRMKR